MARWTVGRRLWITLGLLSAASVFGASAQPPHYLEPCVCRDAAIHTNWSDYPAQHSARFSGTSGFFTFVDYLRFRAVQHGLAYVAKRAQLLQADCAAPPCQLQDSLENDTLSIKVPAFDWSNNYRFGLGYNFCADWDLVASYTYYKGHATSRHRVPVPDLATLNPSHHRVTSLVPLLAIRDLTSGTLAASKNEFFSFSSAHLKANVALLDLELGKKFFVSHWFAFRPFLGGRGAWIRESYRVLYQSPPIPSLTSPTSVLDSVEDRLKLASNYQAGGIRAGVEPQFGLFKGVSLYGLLASAFLIGHLHTVRDEQLQFHELTVEETLIATQQLDIDWDFSTARGRAITDLAVGLAWDRYFACNAVHLGLHLGWETIFLPRQTQLIYPAATLNQNTGYGTQDAFEDQLSAVGDLTLQGWVFGLRLDF